MHSNICDGVFNMTRKVLIPLHVLNNPLNHASHAIQIVKDLPAGYKIGIAPPPNNPQNNMY